MDNELKRCSSGCIPELNSFTKDTKDKEYEYRCACGIRGWAGRSQPEAMYGWNEMMNLIKKDK